MGSYGAINDRTSLTPSSTKKWGHIGISAIGLALGMGGGVAGFSLKNIHLGSWGLVSGLPAGVLLHIAILHKAGLVGTWYTPKILCSIIKLGIVGIVLGIIGTAAYITIAVVQHHGQMLPTSFYYSAIGSSLTIIWSCYLILLTWKLKRELENQGQPLLGDIRPYPDSNE